LEVKDGRRGRLRPRFWCSDEGTRGEMRGLRGQHAVHAGNIHGDVSP